MNRTPGEWEIIDDKIVSDDFKDTVIALVRPVGSLPYDYHNDTQPTHSAKGNAQFIVQACNSYDKLLNTLTHVRAKIGSLWNAEALDSAREKYLHDILTIIDRTLHKTRD